jgi:hypothetical protein
VGEGGGGGKFISKTQQRKNETSSRQLQRLGSRSFSTKARIFASVNEAPDIRNELPDLSASSTSFATYYRVVISNPNSANRLAGARGQEPE